MTKDVIHYKYLPNIVDRCSGPFIRVGEIRRKLMRADPNHDGSFHRSELEKTYDIPWSELRKRYNYFLYERERSGCKGCGLDLFIRAADWVLALDFKKNLKVQLSDNVSAAALERRRAESRKNYAPKILDEPRPTGESAEASGDSWLLEAILIGANLLVWGTVVGLLLRNRKNKGGDDDSSSPEPHAAPQPPAVQPQTLPQPDLRTIAGKMEIDFKHPEAAYYLRLKAQDAGITLTLRKSAGSDIRIEGLSNPSDAIPVLYYWIQHNMRDLADEPTYLSLLFVDLARRCEGIKVPSPYDDARLGMAGQLFELEHLINRVAHQLEKGFNLFDVEANTAHLASYFRKKADNAPPGELLTWYEGMSSAMNSVIRSFSTGNPEMVDKWYKHGFITCRDTSFLPQYEKDVFMMMIESNRAELYYRQAACLEHVGQIQSMLEMIKVMASSVRENIVIPPEESEENRSLDMVSNQSFDVETETYLSLKKCVGEGSCRPTGIMVPGYGPTSASIMRDGSRWAIMSLTCIKAVGR